MRILIVEDNQPLALSLQEMLEAEGYEVRLASDGQDGYSAYLLFEPNLVITDIQMPRENGLELMVRIRTHDPMVRTIYMSGDLSQFFSPLEEEKKRYPVSLLEKPFSRSELLRLVGTTEFSVSTT